MAGGNGRSSNGDSPMKRSSSWKKGQSGNPAGRPPKVESLTSYLRNMTHKAAPASLLKKAFPNMTATQRKNMTYKQAMIAKLLELAVGGDLRAIELVFERVDGKVAMKVNIVNRLRTFAEAYGLDPDEAVQEAEAILSSGIGDTDD